MAIFPDMERGKRVVLTGAAGFIGSHVAESLLQSGFEVVAVDNYRTGKPENLSTCVGRDGFSFERRDIALPGEMDSLCEKYRPEAIVHLAALVSVAEAEASPDLNFRLNVEATHLVAEAARKSGVRRIVFASSAAVYGDKATLPIDETAPSRPVGLYGMAKRASEEILAAYARRYGIETVSLRFFNVYGPRQDPKSPYSGVLSIFSRCFREGRPVTIFGDGSQTRDFVFVGDVARAVALATGSDEAFGAEVCNVCTGRAVSLLEVVETLAKCFGGGPDPLFESSRPGDIRHSHGCPSRAREKLGFQSGTDLGSGVAALLEAFRGSTGPVGAGSEHAFRSRER